MTKDTLLAAAKNFRNTTPGVRAAIEKLAPWALSQEDVDDIEGDWLVAEVQLARGDEKDNEPLRRAHEMIRKLLCDRAARVKT